MFFSKESTSIRTALRTATLYVALIAALFAMPALAEDDSDDTSSYWRDHFSLHGYLTLGWADLDIGDREMEFADEVILGIEEGGSFPYGNGALNLRFDANPKNSFILQLSVSELGDSPLDDEGGEIELDWLFYQAQLSKNTRLRLGRFPVPAGIFNELRDVGVVLPFFRPSFVFYREGSLFSETIDGAGISHRLFANNPWSLDADLFLGEFDVVEQGVGTNTEVSRIDASEAVGTQFWLNTPVDGLRFGLGSQRWKLGEDSGFSLEEAIWKSWYASAEASFEHFVARFEFRRLNVEIVSQQSGAPVEATLDSYYYQLGWLATEKLRFFLQPEFSNVKQQSPSFVGGETSFRFRKDTGFSVVYDIRPNVVLRGEYHEVDAEVQVDREIVFGPMGVQVRNIYDGFDSDYSILSLAVSF